MMIKTTVYHTFTHGCDEWSNSRYEALALYKEWARETGSARLYEETYINDELVKEDCLQATGEFPC